MQFAEPRAFYLLLLIPALAALFVWSSRAKRRAAARLGDRSLVDRLSLGVSPFRDRAKSALFVAGLLFLILALARPQWGRGTEEVAARGVDVFLVLDTSFSMDATDVAPSRMARARYIASELMKRLQGNRIGLVVFSGAAFIQCPLTLDYGAARVFLDSVATGVVPKPGTNIVQALDAASRGFVARNSKYRVVVLLTDGEELEGNAVGAAEKLAKDGIVVHAVGIGTPGGEPIPVRDDSGNVTDYVRDDSGQPVLSRLDEKKLSEIALATGGKYFRLSGADREIEDIAGLVSAMEGETLQARLFRSYQERFTWPLALALVLLVTESLVPREASRKERA
jgi:Ca-activated chloride channel family protein